MSFINYTIGRAYRYEGSTKKYVLEEADDFVFRFACGHWCTDCVFLDLIDCKTGIRVSDNTQTKIEF